MKRVILFTLALFLGLSATLCAEESIDASKAILGTWVLDEEATWNRFRESPEWLNMTPDQQLEYRTTVWPKAQAMILSMAYHFKSKEILVVVSGRQNVMPAEQVSSGDAKVVYQIGEGSRKAQLSMVFINPHLITIQSGGGEPNYYVWKRQGKPDSK